MKRLFFASLVFSLIIFFGSCRNGLDKSSIKGEDLSLVIKIDDHYNLEGIPSEGFKKILQSNDKATIWVKDSLGRDLILVDLKVLNLQKVPCNLTLIKIKGFADRFYYDHLIFTPAHLIMAQGGVKALDSIYAAMYHPTVGAKFLELDSTRNVKLDRIKVAMLDCDNNVAKDYDRLLNLQRNQYGRDLHDEAINFVDSHHPGFRKNIDYVNGVRKGLRTILRNGEQTIMYENRMVLQN